MNFVIGVITCHLNDITRVFFFFIKNHTKDASHSKMNILLESWSTIYILLYSMFCLRIQRVIHWVFSSQRLTFAREWLHCAPFGLIRFYGTLSSRNKCRTNKHLIDGFSICFIIFLIVVNFLVIKYSKYNRDKSKWVVYSTKLQTFEKIYLSAGQNSSALRVKKCVSYILVLNQ